MKSGIKKMLETEKAMKRRTAGLDSEQIMREFVEELEDMFKSAKRKVQINLMSLYSTFKVHKGTLFSQEYYSYYKKKINYTF